MKTKLFFFLSFLLIFNCLLTTKSQSQTVQVFYDDFGGSTVNSLWWHFPTWTSPTDGTFLGLTQLRCTQNASPLPPVNGNAVITLDTYNPTGTFFYGTDLITNRTFIPGAGLIFTVRAKMLSPMPGGIVGAMYLYKLTTGTNHDEIDYELLSNHPDRVHMNIYDNEPHGTGHPDSVNVALPITDYHIYTIKWKTDSVIWLIDGQIVKVNTTLVPNGPMHFNLEMWVPGIEWYSAYNSNLQYVNSASLNQTYTMLVDYVKVDSVDITVGVDQPVAVNVSVFPNPTVDMITVDVNDPVVGSTLLVSNMLGQVLSEQKITENKTRIDLSSYPAGIYLVQLPEQSIVKKIVKK